MAAPANTCPHDAKPGSVYCLGHGIDASLGRLSHPQRQPRQQALAALVAAAVPAGPACDALVDTLAPDKARPPLR